MRQQEESRKIAAMIDHLNDILRPAGLFVRGGFHPEPDDDIPDLPGGGRAGTVVLIGNAGADMWRAFSIAADMSARNPLDNWLRTKIDGAAGAVGAHVVLPNSGPPFVPIHEWAARAEPVYRSPIGIMIHSEFGLWHAYRAALLFPGRIALPSRGSDDSPCDTCARKSCLKVCPADAFLTDRFDASACAAHLESHAGTNCRVGGCLARRACPVGREYLYVPDQQKFHTAAMLRAVRSGYGLEIGAES